jgi:hypothetical protein
MMAACGQCHNYRLDQTLTRARFNVDLAKMSAEQLKLAITRMNLPLYDPQVMPPPRFGVLNTKAKAQLKILFEAE